MFQNFLKLTICVIFIAVPSILNAQGFGLGDDLSVETNPALPGAHEQVSLRLSSFGTDLNRSEIFWYVNDELESSGVGQRGFQFTTGDLGERMRVDIIVRTSAGGRLERTLTFQPAEVDVLWSSFSYTPPFYKGKALAPSKGLVRLMAIPQFFTSRGARIDPGELIYTWEQDGVVLGRISGYGRDNVVIQTKPVPRGRTSVTLSVSSFSNTLRAQKTLSMRTMDPFILFYEKHPLEGIRYERALGDGFTLAEEEITVRAEPYFFSLDDIANDKLEYQWSLNNKKIAQTGADPRELTLRQENEAGGVARVGLQIENISRLLQLARSAFQMNFSGIK